MKEKVIKDFASVLVHNYYEKNPNSIGNNESVIADILMQIREASSQNNINTDTEMKTDHEKIEFITKLDGSTYNLSFKHDELPNSNNQEEVTKLIEMVLCQIFYK